LVGCVSGHSWCRFIRKERTDHDLIACIRNREQTYEEAIKYVDCLSC
jgi:hypothetical protein